MDTAKLKTLEQVSDAMDEVETARAVPGLSADDMRSLEKMSLALRDAERTIIKSSQEELVDGLKADAAGLKELAEKINTTAADLDRLKTVLNKTNQAIDGLVTVISTATKAGLL